MLNISIRNNQNCALTSKNYQYIILCTLVHSKNVLKHGKKIFKYLFYFPNKTIWIENFMQ